MGCIIRPSPSTNSSPLANLSPFQVPSDNHSKILTKAPSIVSVATLTIRPCMKFSLQYETYINIPQSINIIESYQLSCSSEYRQILESYQSFISSVSYFDTMVHSVCIEKYSFIKAIKLLMIYIISNEGSEKSIIHTDKFPFFDFPNCLFCDKECISSWEDLIDNIKALKKNKKLYENFLHIKYIYKIITEITNQVSDEDKQAYKKILRVLKNTIELIDNMYILLNNMIYNIKSFKENLQSYFPTIQALSFISLTFQDKSPKSIVHFIYSDLNTNHFYI
ncbi:hypothetical protein SteCoe_5780 [Stentor coeruleus]|uniref:Uncharacterized protein n=1 Tax=Stentor coeruleus TaxID=5963 RepID=A0A1R2CRK9_9CILI|nr:hypothetical protein SteCoe_5780 [Stentor coeruleus]